MRLTRFVVRILTNEHYLHLVERTLVESIEYETAWRIARMLRIFGTHECYELFEVGFVELRLQLCLPGGMYLYLSHEGSFYFASPASTHVA